MSKIAKRLEVRDNWKARFFGTTAGWIVRILTWTISTKVEDRCGVTTKGNLEHPLIWCAWHNRIVGFVMCRPYVPWRHGSVLASASHDGALLAAVAKVFGVNAVRGSSSRRGSAALKGMLRLLKSGLDVGVTPDGPRGPRYRMHSGVIKLAQVTQTPLLALHVRYSRAWRIKTWDRFVIPFPFSKVTIVFDELLEVPRQLDDDAFEAKRVQLEEMMRGGVDDLDLEVPERRRRKRKKR